MDINKIWGNIFHREEGDRKLYTALREVPMFSRFSNREIGELVRIVHTREYKAGEPIFVEGQTGAGMFIIRSGSVRIMLNFNTDEEILLATLGPGDFFGEVALLNEAPRTASCVAQATTEVIGFYRPDLLELVERSPRFGVQVILTLAEVIGYRLGSANRELQKLFHKYSKLRERLGEDADNPEITLA